MKKFLLIILALCLIFPVIALAGDGRDPGEGLVAVVIQQPPQLLPGKLYETTGSISALKNIKPLSQGDLVIEVLEQYHGGPFSKIRIWEVENLLIDAGKKYAGKTVRFRVFMLDGSSGWSLNLNGGIYTNTYTAGKDGSSSSSNSGMSGIGWSSTNASPSFVVIIYLCEHTEESEEGWS